jgi:hypothetical protein
LIALLEERGPDAEVLLMTGAGYPWQSSVAGLAVRGDSLESEEEEEEEDGPESTGPSARAPRRDGGAAEDAELPRTDVFLVEGRQVRYGAKRARETLR